MSLLSVPEKILFKPALIGEDILNGETFYMLVDTSALEKLKACLYYTGDALVASRLYGALLLECKLVQQVNR